jgi:hypothetical protein
MRSPFPGMNPYLEAPSLWPEVHHWLIMELARSLNQAITPKYRAVVSHQNREESVQNLPERYLEIREISTGKAITRVEISFSPDQGTHKFIKILTYLNQKIKINLQDPLPCFVMPLRSEDEGPMIDLNVVMQTVYQSAALDLVIDYAQPPIPMLSAEDWDWVRSIGNPSS